MSRDRVAYTASSDHESESNDHRGVVPHQAHVCFICPYIEAYLKPGSMTHVGGAQRQQHMLATRLREEGYTVSFITFETKGDAYERIDGFDVLKTLPKTNNPIQAPKTFMKLLRSVQRVEADVFYVRGNPPLCILASYCCSLLGEPLVYVLANDSNVELARLSSHHGLFRYTTPKLAYLDAIRRTDRIVSQTGYQRDLLQNVFGIQSEVVPNGYTLPPADDIVPASERSHVLWVGSLDPDQKRPERLLELAEALGDVEFCMIGWSNNDEYRERIISHANDLSNLSFEGFVSPDQIWQYYKHAVMLVNTSEYEGFPNTFLEAWRYAVPIVSLHHTLDGVLVDHDIGCHAGTTGEMTRTVAKLWNDRNEAMGMGRKGRRYLAENFAFDVIFEKYTRIFGDLVA